MNLAQAQRERELLALSHDLDQLLLASKDVGPEERRKLKNLLSFYAKKSHPFTACVRDNRKRFGDEGAKRVCATLKDIIRGTTKWRKGRQTANMAQEQIADLLQLAEEVEARDT